ncbi:MAG: glutathione synthase [Burkholderiaceae bacterium]
MRILFVCDPPQTFKPEKDSTRAMMVAAQARGHVVWVCGSDDLQSRWDAETTSVSITAQRLTLLPWQGDSSAPWYAVAESRMLAPSDLDLAIMRKDPPFDVHYLVATQMLDRLIAHGLPVINQPQALRDHGEKMAVLEFAQWAPPGMVSHDMQSLRAFAQDHPQVVYKPLDAMGGAGIFVSHARDPNLPVIVEMLTEHGQRAIMVQRFLPEIAQGDKRILLINGIAVPHCLARIPPEGASRGNLAAGGRGEARPLSARDREIAEALGPILVQRGLFLVGLDVIGDCLTEINVTSPTGFQEITRQTGYDVATQFVLALEAQYGARAA